MDLSFIFLTLCVLDQINPPMHFLSRNIFKIPLMIYLILVIGQSIAAIAANRRAQRRKLRKANNRHIKRVPCKTVFAGNPFCFLNSSS